MNPYRPYLVLLACLSPLLGCTAPRCFSRCAVEQRVTARVATEEPTLSLVEAASHQDSAPMEVFTEEELIAAGLWNSPGYQELLADLEITHADIVAANQIQNPSVSTMFPIGPKQWELTLGIPLDFLYLRPVRVAAAELESQRVGERLVQDGLNTVRDIRVAFIDWRAAIERQKLIIESANLRGELARIAQARVDAGDISKLSVSALKVDAQVAVGDRVRAARDVEFAEQRLRYLLGAQMSNLPIESVAPSPLPQSFDQLDGEALALEATGTRPDLRAIELAVRAAEYRAELARRDIFQIVGVLPDLNSKGDKGFEAGPGLQMRLPIFHQNQGAQMRACADAVRLRRQYANRRDIIAMEVKQAVIRFQQAEQELSIWQNTVTPQAAQSLATAQTALKEDAVNILLLLQLSTQLLAAQQRELAAEIQVRNAAAELERSVGRRLFNYNDTFPGAPLRIPPRDIPADDEFIAPPAAQSSSGQRSPLLVVAPATHYDRLVDDADVCPCPRLQTVEVAGASERRPSDGRTSRR